MYKRQTTVVPKRSRDSVSDDAAFRRPAVELLVVTMQGWALPCHTKRGFRTPSSASYCLKFYLDVFDASANHISKATPNFSDFCGVMAFFLISPKRQISLTSFFFVLFWSTVACMFFINKMSPQNFSSNSSIYSVHEQFVPPRTVSWTSS